MGPIAFWDCARLKTPVRRLPVTRPRCAEGRSGGREQLEIAMEQISSLLQTYTNNQFELFEPLAVSLQEGKQTIITPPVVEKISAHQYVVIEGNTRAFYCRWNDIPRFRCIVVQNVGKPLPADPIDLRYVRVVTRRMPREQRMKNFKSQYFRHIEGAVHAA